MKAAYAPLTVALVISATGAGLLPVCAQLPPTNMGKFIHQPGDNQYSPTTQQERHGGAPAPVVQFQAAPPQASDYTPAPAPKRPDITLEPIAADEPIPPSGFPPLPDRLDLPVAGGGSTWTGSPGTSSPSYRGGGGAAPGMSSGAGGGAAPSYHQHYGHVEPGAFLQQNQGGGRGYYKAIDPGLPARSPGADQYNMNPGMSAPAYTGASASQLRSLGREPGLNERPGQAPSPDAPAPVVVNQSTTQDLSLPEDEFNFKQKKKGPGVAKTIGRVIRGPLNSVGGMAGVRF